MRLPAGDTHFNKAAMKGRYQRNVICMSMSQVRDWHIAVDIGAHVGFVSNDLAKFFTLVHAFEPQPENIRCLKENKRRNVIVHEVALGDARGTCSMTNPAPHNSGAWVAGPGDEIKVFPLDEFDLIDVGLIKIDVQGNQLSVLSGARETILRNRPVLQVECGRDEIASMVNDKAAVGSIAYLTGLGAVPKMRIRQDVIWGWNE